jgi:hypothetical protein
VPAEGSWSAAGKVVIRNEGKWTLLRKGLDPVLEDRFCKQLQAQESGSVVQWEVLDRLGHNSRDTDVAETLQLEVAWLDEHLSMVFHRFSDEPAGFRYGCNWREWIPRSSYQGCVADKSMS